MQSARKPKKESLRIEELWNLEILDTDPEQAFDQLTQLAQQIFNVPIVLVSLVDEERQWFKSRQGLSACETGRDVAFCAHAILQDELFIIEDATQDDRFSDNPLVTGEPKVIFYAGFPLKLESGLTVGTLCLIDNQPRTLNDTEKNLFKLLGKSVVNLLEQRKKLTQLGIFSHMMEKLHELDVAKHERLSDYIRVGLEVLKLDFGIISHVHKDKYQVIDCITPHNEFGPGTFFELEGTYCDAVIKKQMSVFYKEVGAIDSMKDHPVYINMRLESYIGCPIKVNGKIFGTINFSSQSIKRRDFSREEARFIEHLANSVGKIIEINERKNSSDRIAEILDFTPEFIGVADLISKKFVFMNKSFRENFDFDMDHFDLAPFFAPDELKRFEARALTTAMKTGTWEGEFPLLTKNGVTIPTYATVVIRKNEKGEPCYMSAVVHDISELKNKENELREKTKQAQQAAQAKGAFLANMSHEIRTPLNAIIGYSDLLVDSIRKGPNRDMAMKLQTASTYLHQLLNDVLDLSKIEANQMNLMNEVFNLNEIISSVETIFSHQAQEKDLRFLVINESNRTDIFGDKTKLTQVMINLIGNAFKFTEKGDISVHISSNKTHRPGNLHLMVKDTGVGIHSDKLKHIFETFSQEEAFTSKRYGGTGLGLAICKSIAQMMGGDIWVKSAKGKGSEFHCTFHFEDADECLKHKNDESTQSSPENKTLRILLVDDNNMNRDIFKAYLKKSPHFIQEAKNGEDALEKLKKEEFDIVFLDMQMPVKDGFDTIAEFRAWELENELEPTLVYALSAFATQEEIDRALAAGCNQYLTKPLRKRDLLKLVS